MKLEIKKSKTFSDQTGSLVPFYKNTALKKFKIVRFFFIYGNKKYHRANHAHKKCNQILIPIYGKIQVDIVNEKGINKKFILCHKKNNYLNLPKKNWVRLKFLIKNSILLTLCDYRYDKKEYIQSKKEFFDFVR